MTIIQHRRGTAAEWTAANPVLADAEFGYEHDTGKFKIGNGTSTWAQLEYFMGSTAVTALVGSQVTTSLGNYALKDSPALVGTPTAPTPPLADNDTSIATSAFVAAALVADHAVYPGRNAIRNGDFSIAQRGPGPFVGGGYHLDGWRQDFANGSMSTTQIKSVWGGSAQLDGAQFGLQSVIVGGVAAGDYAQHSQNIESVLKYAGKKVTLTFKAKANAGTPKIGIEISQNFGGPVGPASPAAPLAIQAISLSTVETEYSVTFTVPAITGKTLGTDGKDFLQFIIWTSSGTTYASRASGIGVQSFTLTLFDVQLELGPTKTAFDRLSQQAQLAWCQRYLFTMSDPALQLILSNGGNANGTGIVAVIQVKLPQTMRAIPVFIAFPAANLMLSDRAVNVALIAIALTVVTSKDILDINCTVAAGLTAFRPYILQVLTVGTIFGVQAEL